MLQVNSVLWRGIVVPPDQNARPRRVGRIRPSAGRRRAAWPAAGDRSFRRLLSSRTTDPRRRLSRRLRRAGRGADRSVLRRRSSSRARRLTGRGRPISASSTPRPARALAPVAAAPAPGQYAVSAGVYSFSAGRRRQRARALLRLCAAGRRAGGARAGGRTLPRRRAHRPHVEIALAAKRRSPTTRARSPAPILAMLQPYKRVALLMFAIGLEGLDEASARLDALPAALAAALAAKAAELAAALADRVRNDKLAGAVLNARSGALRDSIAADVAADGDGVVASVGSVGDVKYAAIQEYGGRTAAHEILPRQGAGARLHRRRRACASPARSSIPARSIPGAVLSALFARGDERRDRRDARRGRRRSPGARMSREAAFSALFATVSAAYPWGLASRRMKLWSEVPAAMRPAFFQLESGPETYQWTSPADAEAHVRSEALPLFRLPRSDDARARPPSMRRSTPSTRRSRPPAADAALGRQTLGGAVYDCKIVGVPVRDTGRPRRRRAGGGERAAGRAVKEGASCQIAAHTSGKVAAARLYRADVVRRFFFFKTSLSFGAQTRLAEIPLVHDSSGV